MKCNSMICGGNVRESITSALEDQGKDSQVRRQLKRTSRMKRSSLEMKQQEEARASSKAWQYVSLKKEFHLRLAFSVTLQRVNFSISNGELLMLFNQKNICIHSHYNKLLYTKGGSRRIDFRKKEYAEGNSAVAKKM